MNIPSYRIINEEKILMQRGSNFWPMAFQTIFPQYMNAGQIAFYASKIVFF